MIRSLWESTDRGVTVERLDRVVHVGFKFALFPSDSENRGVTVEQLIM